MSQIGFVILYTRDVAKKTGLLRARPGLALLARSSSSRSTTTSWRRRGESISEGGRTRIPRHTAGASRVLPPRLSAHLNFDSLQGLIEERAISRATTRGARKVLIGVSHPHPYLFWG
jgi:hypothetical protein